MFDLDGTLLPMDQEVFARTYLRSLGAYVAPLGYDPRLIAKRTWDGMEAMVSNNGTILNEQAFWDCFRMHFGDRVLRDRPAFEEYYRTEFKKVKSSCGFEPAVPKLIRGLRQAGVSVGLATNPIFPPAATHERIRWAGLEPEDFLWITTYDNSHYCKPNPDYFREILEKIGKRPEDCIMVGNDAHEDMAAAELGIPVFLLTPCLINTKNRDLSKIPHGDFDDLKNY